MVHDWNVNPVDHDVMDGMQQELHSTDFLFIIYNMII